MKIGDKFKGTITGIKSYGAFVQLENGITGLIHISEIKTGYIDNIYDEFKIGQEVTVQVIDFDEYTQKASLSIRTLEEERNQMPHRHRFSNNRLNIGFKPLGDSLSGWIEESLSFLAEQNKTRKL